MTVVRPLATIAALLWAGSALAAEVNIYNGRHYTTDNAIYETFTKQTGIKVNIIEGDASQLIQRIKTEGANSPADILITVDAGRLAAAAEQGLFADTKSAILEQAVPASLRHPTGEWFAVATRARVIVYNKDKVKADELTTWENIADPKWKGRLLVRSGGHIYNLSLLGAAIENMGEAKAEAWAKGIAANMARPGKGGDTDQIRGVAAGEGDIAISNSYYLARLIASDKAEDKVVANKVGVAFVEFAGKGVHVNVSGAGILKTSKNKAEAQKLLEYLVSPEAQRLLADSSFEFPVNQSVKAHPILADFGTFKIDTTNAAAFGANNKKAQMIMDRVGWK